MFPYRCLYAQVWDGHQPHGLWSTEIPSTLTIQAKTAISLVWVKVYIPLKLPVEFLNAEARLRISYVSSVRKPRSCPIPKIYRRNNDVQLNKGILNPNSASQEITAQFLIASAGACSSI